MRHYNWCDDQAAMSSVAYACIYIAMTSNHMARLDPADDASDEEERDTLV